jgi:ABC-type multidrug transport system fused ATPase/permease subunit
MFWAVRRYTSLELSFNAVERVVEFMEMDQEAPAIVEPRPPASVSSVMCTVTFSLLFEHILTHFQWPSEGQIEVKDLEIKYAADLDPVLHGISFSVNSREKIGVVGRTGSGKSTLALSFFRFVEASRGSIIIDGIDISKIGTEDLRSNLTVIPQDPTLFSGTLRSNLDPFDQFEDSDIFESLRRVHLLPSSDDEQALVDEESNINVNVFRSLGSPG